MALLAEGLSQQAANKKAARRRLFWKLRVLTSWLARKQPLRGQQRERQRRRKLQEQREQREQQQVPMRRQQEPVRRAQQREPVRGQRRVRVRAQELLPSCHKQRGRRQQ